MGVECDHLASVVSYSVNVRSHGDIMTLTAIAATADIVLDVWKDMSPWSGHHILHVKPIIRRPIYIRDLSKEECFGHIMTPLRIVVLDLDLMCEYDACRNKEGA
ncbi:auxin canalization protein (DUF828) [Artemisia annua]|uniref:Auxin canalization protein (DUF828) n=1 Tax=Artemisia annua TaxID=35608 RepID=A0A2U1MES3_ARTAN|nr:auxin canalization protein (DUF828) [Artemisia annua]